MKISEWLLLAVLIGIAGAIILPPVLFTNRLVETWTTEYTAQLLGGFLGICGGSLTIIGVLIGAGLFARLAGWKAPPPAGELRLRGEQPTVIDGQWRELPLNLPGAPPSPPWGVTGGGNYALLAPPAQDRRFSIDPETEDDTRRNRKGQ
ncbi:MAG: hypothetical protein M3Q45_09670 [Chloroflexota bacterium]|nr:hypothetical protein [Chloroflexota bacterium]